MHYLNLTLWMHYLNIPILVLTSFTITGFTAVTWSQHLTPKHFIVLLEDVRTFCICWCLLVYISKHISHSFFKFLFHSLFEMCKKHMTSWSSIASCSCTWARRIHQRDVQHEVAQPACWILWLLVHRTVREYIADVSWYNCDYLFQKVWNWIQFEELKKWICCHYITIILCVCMIHDS